MTDQFKQGASKTNVSGRRQTNAENNQVSANENLSTPLQVLTPEEIERIKKMHAEYVTELNKYLASLPKIRQDGKAALVRLLDIAHDHSGQCRYVAGFLLGLYNGTRFPFDLTDFRALDFKIFRDCLLVLAMDKNPEKEVHRYFQNGSEIFERLAERWMIGQYRKPEETQNTMESDYE